MRRVSKSMEQSSNSSFEEAPSKRRSIIDVQLPTKGIVPAAIEFDDVIGIDEAVNDNEKKIINMYSMDNVGLYCHYAAVGLLYGISGGPTRAACTYVYDGPKNYCANISSLVLLSWNLKIVYAVLTDLYWPLGMRRKPYIVASWAGVLALLFFLSVFFKELNAETFGLVMLFIQAIFMFGNVPADGYSVELADYEDPEHRGQILATGQAIRFTTGILVNFFQSFLLNGPETNAPDTIIAWDGGWTWGLSLGSYFLLIFVLILCCFIPMLKLKEVSSDDVPRRNFFEIFGDMWAILQSKTTFYLILYGTLMRSIAGLVPVTYAYTSLYILKIPSLLVGIEDMMEYFLLTLAVVTFKTYLINKNWRYVNYFSEVLATIYSFTWFLVYYDIAGLRNGWFTVFINISSTYIEGLIQVLLSVAVIEIAKKGMEATTYELLISVNNSALTLGSIIATQISTLFSINIVDIEDEEEFEESGGPAQYALYTGVIQIISIIGLIIATRFLPINRDMCHQWKQEGEEAGLQLYYGCASLSIAFAFVIYGIFTSFFFFNPSLSCSEFVGGEGCSQDQA